MTWQGRRLKTYQVINYIYDVNGIRTSKFRNGVTYKYIYDGNNLVAEQHISNTASEWLYFIYGVDGVAGFEYNGNTYLYRKNVQGDVTHVYKKLTDGTLELVAQYAYDAWGNFTTLENVGNIATLNPFRYRSYYFDEETKLYYLQTRYYDPELGRFINADSIEYLDPEKLGGLNLYAYCGNNPVMGYDPEGNKLKWWQWLIAGLVAVATFAFAAITFGVGFAIAATIAGAATGALYGYSLAKATGQDIGECIGIGILSGIALGNIATGAAGLVLYSEVSLGAAAALTFGLSCVVGAGAEILSQVSSNNTVTDWDKVRKSALQWGILNTVNFALGYVTEPTILATFVGGYIYNHITGVIGFIIDLIKNGYFKKGRNNIYGRQERTRVYLQG